MTLEMIESFLFSALRISTPLMYVALCAVVSQQGGLLNMAAESMMLTSALTGVIVSAVCQNLWLGILAGALSSMLITLFLCFATFVMKVDLYLMSIAMNTALMGGTIYVMWAATGSKANTAAYYASLQMPQIQIPIIKDIPFLGAVLSGHNGFTYLGWIMIFAVWFLIFRTKLGLRIRSVGQNPQAAESVGISPRKIYTISFLIAGLIASFGGMFLSMGYQNMFIREMTGGKGFIGMAAATIANASPVGAALISVVFGLSDAVTNYSKLYITDAQFLAAMPYLITVILLFVLSAMRQRMDEKRQHKRRLAALKAQEEMAAGEP